MEGEGLILRVFKAFEWIMLFAYLQFIWIVLSVVGLGFLGIIPSTVAMFGIVRKWILGHRDISIFSFMWTTFLREFKKSNLYFYSFIIPGWIIYFYIRLFLYQDKGVSTILLMISVAIGILYLVAVVVAMPIYAHYQLNMSSFYKTICFVLFSYPFHTISIGAILVGFYYVISWIPGLFPFLSFSILSFFIMLIANLAFREIDKKLIISVE